MIAPASLYAGGGLLLLAAMHDIATRTVPNGVSVLLALGGLGSRIVDGKLAIGLGMAAAVFIVAAAFWRRGWMGGADVKLLGASALLVSPAHVFPFIAATAIAGSLLAALYLAVGYCARSGRPSGSKQPTKVRTPRSTGLFARVTRAELWRIRRGGPLPYACAIAAGFLFILS